jgi:hypothetical protein
VSVLRAVPNGETAALRARLQARRAQLEEAILTRVYGIDDLSGVSDQQYSEGLRRAVAAAVDFGVETIDLAEEGRAPAVPQPLLIQARLAARNRISLDTVLRRYCGGNALFADALIEAIEGTEVPRRELQRLLRTQATNFDRLLAVVSEEYDRERRDHSTSGEQRRIEMVERLLAGDLLDAPELAYDFDVWHIGLVGSGGGAADAIRRFAANLNQALLLVERQEGTVWAWLGSRRRQHFDDPDLQGTCSPQVALAIGEPAEGLTGWRFSHRQASAAHPIAREDRGGITRYADAPLLAAALKDDLLATSLRRFYLEPLGEGRSGLTAKRTLRAYFTAGCNGSSAAAALSVSRRTVSSRLAAVEQKLGRSVDSASAELQTVLLLDETDAQA